MSLRIRKLATECRVPRGYRNEASVVDGLAHGRFSADLAGHLGPSLSRQPAIVRIRHLPIRVIIPGSDLNEAALSKAWTEAFSRALFTALAYPTGAGPLEVFRAGSPAAFVAAVIRDLLDGTAAGKWQYAEFDELFRAAGNQAPLYLLCEWAHLTFPILLELDRSDVLERLLRRLDDISLERLFALLTPAADSHPPALSIADLEEPAKLLLRRPPQKLAALRTRAYALRLYVLAHSMHEVPRSPRALFHALLALAALLTEDLSVFLFTPSAKPATKNLPPPVVTILQSIARELASSPQSPRLSALRQLLLDVRSVLNLPPSALAEVPARWISSDWCGLFFLTSTLHRLGWIPAWEWLSDFRSGGVSPLLAGLWLSITGNFETRPAVLDPGLALLSGYLGEPGLSHLYTVFQESPAEVSRRAMRAALGDEESADTWPDTFHRLAEFLLQNFASHIRGFQNVNSQSIVRTFLQRAGRIRVEETRIVVQPDPSPFHVALHIAGMDSPLESVSWLGGRRLEFEIGEI